MAYYYLRKKGSEQPKTEKEFDYLVYTEQPTTAPIQVPLEQDTSFLAHEMLDNPKWHWDDEVITIRNTFGVTHVQFKKVFDRVGFTVWKRI